MLPLTPLELNHLVSMLHSMQLLVLPRTNCSVSRDITDTYCVTTSIFTAGYQHIDAAPILNGMATLTLSVLYVVKRRNVQMVVNPIKYKQLTMKGYISLSMLPLTPLELNHLVSMLHSMQLLVLPRTIQTKLPGCGTRTRLTIKWLTEVLE